MLALLVASVVILANLTRGTPLEDQHAGKRVLRVSFEMNLSEINEVWNAVKREFEAQHPDVVIVLIDDIDQKASIYEAANKLPDIISTNTFSLHRYKNVMLPLDDLVARDQAEHQPDDFYPDIIESCRFAGDLFLVPYFLMYRCSTTISICSPQPVSRCRTTTGPGKTMWSRRGN